MISVETNSQEQVISSNLELNNKIEHIPDKLGFKIGEVAQYVGVKQYVLRYWETEFDVLSPKKSANGQRVYTKKDIEVALIIRKLLHADRFSIEGARTVLKRLKQQGRSLSDMARPQEMEEPEMVRPHIEKGNRPTVSQIEKALQQRENELSTKWVSSVEYLLAEIRQSRQRLFE